MVEGFKENGEMPGNKGHEARGRAGLAKEWFAALDAPRKRLITFERSGHKPSFEEPDRFHAVMTETVLASTYPDRRP